MKFLLSLILIACITLIGSWLTFMNRRLPLGFRNILLTGTEYIIIGVLLGAMGLDIIDSQTRGQLQPFILFGLSCIGFLYGLQFELKQLRTLPRFYLSISAIQACITAAIVSIGIYMIFKFFTALSFEIALLLSFILGSAGACSAQSALAIVSRTHRIYNRNLMELLRYISSTDGLFALSIFAVTSCFVQPYLSDQFSLMSVLVCFCKILLAGIVPSLIIFLFNKTKLSQQEFIVLLIGSLMFAAGLAYEMHVPPLIAGFFCGILTANISRHRMRSIALIIKAEKSIYIILLLLVGAGWKMPFGPIILISGLYFLLRIIGKLSGAYTAINIYKPLYTVPNSFGLALISEGGLAIAIIVDFCILYPAFSDVLVTIIIFSLFANEFLSPHVIVSQMKKNPGMKSRQTA